MRALVATHEPGFLLLQESPTPTAWGRFRTGKHVPDYRIGTWLLAADAPISPVKIHGFSGWLAGGVCRAANREIACLSLHAPSRLPSFPRRSYLQGAMAMVQAIVEIIPPSMPLIIGGDFNFCSFGERRPDEAIQATPDERAATAAWRVQGFELAWRDLHAEAPLPQTLRWTGNRAKPFHCDGFLVRNVVMRDCSVLATDAESPPSDHDSVLLVLEPMSAA